MRASTITAPSGVAIRGLQWSFDDLGDSRRVIGGLMKREPKGIRALERAIDPRQYRVFENMRWRTTGMTDHVKSPSDGARMIGEATAIDLATVTIRHRAVSDRLEVRLGHGRLGPATSVILDGELVTAKIARAHLNAFLGDYRHMEAEAERYWSERSGDE